MDENNVVKEKRLKGRICCKAKKTILFYFFMANIFLGVFFFRHIYFVKLCCVEGLRADAEACIY
jgi:hypothetical protein